MIVGSSDGTVKLLELPNGRVLKTLSRIKGYHEILTVASSPDGRVVFTGSTEGIALLLSTTSGKVSRRLKGHTGPIDSVAFSSDGRLIITGSRDYSARIWETASGRLLTILEGHEGPILAVSFSPDGEQILTGSLDRTARLWETRSGKLLATFQEHNAECVESVNFSPNGCYAITCDSNGVVLFWKAQGQERGDLLGAYFNFFTVNAVYWQGNSQLILADLGGPYYRPHFHRLKLEGTW
jgi:WD40 repeat protein